MKDMTIVFRNMPDDWTEKDIQSAVLMGMFIKTMQKNPELFKKLKEKAKGSDKK